MKNIVSTLNKGFQMTFNNGVFISVQFGYGNYCENRSIYGNDYDNSKTILFDSNDAEILIEAKETAITGAFCDTWGINHDGVVAGWLSSDEVAKAIAWAQGLDEARIQAAIKHRRVLEV